jgi:aquaporin Z
MTILRKMIAEFIGTFTLVFLGCGAAVMAGMHDILGMLGISFAFGLALIGMAYGIGPISGCHINPAVSFGAVVAGRMTVFEMVRYWIAQVGGACVAALLLLILMKGRMAGYDVGANGLGQNGYGEGYLGEYTMFSALLFEVIATFLFVVVILGSTSPGASTTMAGIAIGLTLVVIHLVGIQITGVSVNPARSIGPAIFSGSVTAIQQLWLFIVAPMIGAAGAGIMFREGLLIERSTVAHVDEVAS